MTFALGATTINTTGAADSTTFTATLENANTTSDTIIDLAFAPFNGATTPVLGTDYTVTGETIVIPEGSTTGSITITGNNQNTGEFVVSATKLFGASLGVPTPTTSFDETLTPSLALQGGGGTISGEVVNQNNQPMAGVYVYLGLPVTSALVYQPNDPAYVAGSPFVVTGTDGRYEFTGLSVTNPPGDEYSVSELVPANYVEDRPDGKLLHGQHHFLDDHGSHLRDELCRTRWDVDGHSRRLQLPLVFRNEPAGPADPTGAVGPNDVIQADNNNFIVYNKVSGTIEQTMTLDQFWLPAWNQEAEMATCRRLPTS